ncbi:hypothetical protein EBU99_12075 [bacterium]|nr:hypothetical protein [bacterium]
MSKFWGTLALLGSSATLVCCVIPALMVALGFGAAVAGTIAAVPQLTVLSEHKGIVFLIAGLILAGASYARNRPEAQTCPSDPVLAKACMRSKKLGGVLFKIGVLFYFASLLFVFVLPKLMS